MLPRLVKNIPTVKPAVFANSRCVHCAHAAAKLIFSKGLQPYGHAISKDRIGFPDMVVSLSRIRDTRVRSVDQDVRILRCQMAGEILRI